mgnify:CR=1 FL=1
MTNCKYYAVFVVKLNFLYLCFTENLLNPYTPYHLFTPEPKLTKIWTRIVFSKKKRVFLK